MDRGGGLRFVGRCRLGEFDHLFKQCRLSAGGPPKDEQRHFRGTPYCRPSGVAVHRWVDPLPCAVDRPAKQTGGRIGALAAKVVLAGADPA